MNDVQRWTDTWKQSVPTDQHGFINCYPAYRRWYQGIDPQLAAVNMLEYCRKNIYTDPRVEGALLFSYGDSSGQGNHWKWFDMRDQTILQSALEIQNNVLPSPPAPKPPNIPAPVPTPTPTPAPDTVSVAIKDYVDARIKQVLQDYLITIADGIRKAAAP
jgi:hypothetical protein